MTKRLTLVLLLLVALIALTGCSNRTIFDTTYHFDWAFVSMPDGGFVEGAVQKWRDFDDGDQLQVTIEGVTYLTHATNVVLMSGGVYE